MARVPISFYLNILAGILVLFNHYASSETGDVALNKVTGATGRFYTLFRDTTLTLQRSCASRLETMVCGPTLDSVLPREAAEYLKVRYCHALPQHSGGMGGGSSNVRLPHGGYGGSDSVFVYYTPAMRSLPRQTSERGLLGRSSLGRDRSSQGGLSRVVWDRFREAMARMGVLLLRTCASWWWFKAPLRVTGALVAGHAVLSVFGYMFGASMALQIVTQVYTAGVVDFLGCIQLEAQRLAADVGVAAMVRVYGDVMDARRRV